MTESLICSTVLCRHRVGDSWHNNTTKPTCYICYSSVHTQSSSPDYLPYATKTVYVHLLTSTTSKIHLATYVWASACAFSILDSHGCFLQRKQKLTPKNACHYFWSHKWLTESNVFHRGKSKFEQCSYLCAHLEKRNGSNKTLAKRYESNVFGCDFCLWWWAPCRLPQSRVNQI